MAIERTHEETNPGGKVEKHLLGNPSKDEWNRHCIQIVHTQHQDNETTPKTTTRIFTAPIVERNEWVFAMNNTLLGYEKRLGKARSDAAKLEYRAATLAKKARWFEFEGSTSPRQPRTEDGRSRMRSPSPVRSITGLSPTSPRSVKSPSPKKSVRPIYASPWPITP
mmetsp:Transcript_22785/g.48963  ORF Transcript_22785/g.48963 Transcript_22785/m.48963 type:complete len:166 (+) Transcript_22785:248-745(+)